MIDKKTYDKLFPLMEKHHAVYQKWTRLQKRMPFFLKFIDQFKGRKVLECGCNAGLYGYHIAQVAQSYVGADKGEVYIQQALETKKFIKNKNVKFVCAKVKNFAKIADEYEFDTFFASFALYHFSNKGVTRLKEVILPKCSKVVISTRTAKRSKWNPHNKYEFYKVKNVEKWLKDQGFECKSYPCPRTEEEKKKGRPPHFVITIGEKSPKFYCSPKTAEKINEAKWENDAAGTIEDNDKIMMSGVPKESAEDQLMMKTIKDSAITTKQEVKKKAVKKKAVKRRNYIKKEPGSSTNTNKEVGQTTQEE